MSQVSRRSVAGLIAKYEDDPVVTAVLEELVRLRQEADLVEQQHQQAIRRYADQEERIGLAARRILVLGRIENVVIEELARHDPDLLERLRSEVAEHLKRVPVEEAAEARMASKWCA